MKGNSLKLMAVLIVLALIVACGSLVTPSHAEINFPTRPVNVIIGLPPGGSVDLGSRIMLAHVSRILGQNFVVTNMPGAGGEPAMLHVLNATPDGYTIGAIGGPQLLNPLVRQTQYQLDDFVWIAQQVNDPRAIAIQPNDPRFHDLESFIAYARENPGTVSISNSGMGATGHITSGALAVVGDLDIIHIHTDGAGASISMFLGGHVDAISASMGEIVPMVNEGNALILAFSTEERHPDFPDVPTFIEAGLDFTLSTRRGFIANPAIDPRIIQIIEDAMEQASRDPNYIQEMTNVALPMEFLRGAAFEAAVFEEIPLLNSLVDELGLRQN